MKKEDQRIRITKNLLKKALVEILSTKHISKVSVKEICEKAEINRSTFYSHYLDQFDLIDKIKQEVFADIATYVKIEPLDSKLVVSFKNLNLVLEYMKENHVVCAVLLSENSGLSLQNDLVYTFGFPKSLEQNSDNERRDRYAKEYAIYGCVAILSKWLKDGMPETPSYMAKLIAELLYRGINAE